MKLAHFAAIGVALALCACTTTTGSSPALTAAQVAEKVDTEANLAYVAIASALNAHEALPTTTPAQRAADEATKLKAWRALQSERALYQAGMDASQVAASLQATLKAVGGAAPAASAAAPK